MHISLASFRPSVRRQTSQLFVLITEQPPTAHLNSPARSSGGSFPPPAWHESFLRPPLWPPSGRAAHALNPAKRVNLPALIKIASFVGLSLPPSSCPWWHNGAGNFPPQRWLKKDWPLEKWRCVALFYDDLARNKPHLILSPHLLTLTRFPEWKDDYEGCE